MTRLARLAAVFMVAMHPHYASASEIRHGGLVISQPWARATPNGAKVGGGYLRVENTGKRADRLMGATTDAAMAAEIHEMKTDNGIMTMRQFPNGLVIAAGQSVQFQPGGLHLMFKGLHGPLKQGAHIAVTLDFATAGPVTLDFHVEGIGARQATEPHTVH